MLSVILIIVHLGNSIQSAAKENNANILHKIPLDMQGNPVSVDSIVGQEAVYSSELLIPPARSIRIDGDIILGGVFPVHSKETRYYYSNKICGDIAETRGVHRVEAMLYAIDKVNNDTGLLRGLKLGALIMDSCSTPAFALNQSLDFVRDLIGTSDLSGYQCSDGSVPVEKQSFRKSVAAVVGGSYSSVTVANLLRLFQIAQISPASTNNDLSDKKRFEFFARTVPSDHYQARAMVSIAREFNWTYVSLLYTADEYGDQGADSFKVAAKDTNNGTFRQICIDDSKRVDTEKEKETKKAITELMQKMRTSNDYGWGQVVVLFANTDSIQKIMNITSQVMEEMGEWSAKGKKKKIIWLASEGWDRNNKNYMVDNLWKAADGAIVLMLKSPSIPEFDEASSFHEVELTEISVSKSSFPGVASYGSFRFEENGIRARMFDKIGGGIFIEEKKVIANEFECEVLSEGGYLSKSDGFWKKFDDEEDKDIAPEEGLDENPIVAAKEGIFSCPDRLCISQFLTVNGLAKHKLRGVHRRRKNTESTIDAGVRMFAKAVETDTAAARSVKSDSLVPLKKSIKSKLPDKGWAMKKKEKATKISDEMAVEITEYFHKQRGEGKRALAREICASLKEMKNAKTGEYLFPLDKCPKESHCQTAISSLLREERCATSQKVNPTPKRRKLTNDKEGSEESSDDNQPGGSKDDNDTNQMTTNKRTLKTKKSTSKKETIPIFEDEADDFADFMEEIDAADDPFFD